MSVYDTVIKRRSIRRFQKKRIPSAILRKFINAARLAPSAANLQPCEFIVINKKEIVDRIFPTLRWAGYIEPRGNPPAGKEPVAYIVVLVNVNKSKRPEYAEADVSAAIENILLVAQDASLGSCWLGAIDRARIRNILKIPKYCEVRYVLALGYPDEKAKVEKIKDSIKYWKDKKGTLHVPKRSLKEILHKNRY